MDLLLHIGCEKTGTTSLQAWLDQHDQALAAHGIVYARSLGRPNNRRICYLGLEPGAADTGLEREGITTAEQHAAFQRIIARELAAEIGLARQAGCRLFVISNEHCHSRLKTPQAAARLRAALAASFAHCEIVCFLRPQVDLCLSLASTLSRHGRKIDRFWVNRQLRPDRPYYALDALLARWADAWPEATLTPVATRRQPDTIAWFEARLGVAHLALQRRPPANEALDYRVMVLINALAASGIGPADAAPALAALLDWFPLEQRLTLGRAAAQGLQARFAAGNAALCARFPAITPADLTPDWDRYPQTGTIGALDTTSSGFPDLGGGIERMLRERAPTPALLALLQALRGAPASHIEPLRQANVTDTVV
jgi:hypothetical protein